MITSEVRARIVELGAAGKRATEIVRLFEPRPRIAEVRDVLREAGLIRKGASRGPAPKSKAARAAALVGDGMTIAAAADRLKVSRQAVHEYIGRHGLPAGSPAGKVAVEAIARSR